MTNICYYKNQHGVLVANWPGKTVVTDKGIRKVGQKYLGKVIDKEKLIFWTKKEGYYRFDIESQNTYALAEHEVPAINNFIDGRMKSPSVIVSFGDVFFLDKFIQGIGYDKVLDAIGYRNNDSLWALLMYYTLEAKANRHCEAWFNKSYARYLFPKANLASQRISELQKSLGDPEKQRKFLIAHIKYLLENSDEELCVLIDSTGMPNKCALPITRVSNHQGDVNIEFRLIAVVQKKTGLPIYYKRIAGNTVDISTVEQTLMMLREYGYDVQYCIGDAGYSCPGVLERLMIMGIEFMTRMNPTYNNYTKIVEQYLPTLEKKENVVRYGNRLIYVKKIPTVIGNDPKTGENLNGFIYLCMDLQAKHSKSDHLLSSKYVNKMTSEEVLALTEKLGVFAIVTSKDCDTSDILPEYYVRQGIEQYFDFGKSYAKFLPVREHNMETLDGHLMLSFIATFLTIAIKNRLEVVGDNFVSIPSKIYNKMLQEEKDECIDFGSKEGAVIQQNPLATIVKESPATLFFYLRLQMADVFATKIIPEAIAGKPNDFYKAFNISSPMYVLRNCNSLEENYKEEPKQITKKLVFSTKAQLTDEIILEKRNRLEAKRNQKNNDSSQENQSQTSKKRGRPVGSKNKRTLEREAEVAKELQTGTAKPKRKPGRPLGSKNKRTLEREAKLQKMKAAGLIPPKRKRGRPLGSKNKLKNS